MNSLNEKIICLETHVTVHKKELRRIKSTINKAEKIGITPPVELIDKKEYLEENLKKYKQELKLLKKVVELTK